MKKKQLNLRTWVVMKHLNNIDQFITELEVHLMTARISLNRIFFFENELNFTALNFSKSPENCLYIIIRQIQA